MKRRRIPRPARIPTLVAFFNAPEIEAAERLAIEAIRAGSSETRHFNILADCRDLLAIGADMKDAHQVLGVCELAAIALENIRDRYNEHGRLGWAGDELAALQVMVDVSTDWWQRQSGEIYRVANERLDNARGIKAAA